MVYEGACGASKGHVAKTSKIKTLCKFSHPITKENARASNGKAIGTRDDPDNISAIINVSAVFNVSALNSRSNGKSLEPRHKLWRKMKNGKARLAMSIKPHMATMNHNSLGNIANIATNIST